MAYSAEISRTNPSCFLFLIDQSGSMGDSFGAGESSMTKANGVADAINRLLQNLVIKCAKEEGVPRLLPRGGYLLRCERRSRVCGSACWQRPGGDK